MMRRPTAPSAALSTALLLLLSTACLPYTVGSTAQTVPQGEVVRTVNASFVIGGSAPFDDSTGTVGGSANFLSSDQEIRFGLSDRSDVGLRITSASGLVFNYKRRHSGAAHPDSAGVATMWGAGIVNWAQHAHFESTILFSGRRRGESLPYGGFRVMHTLPLEAGAVRDTPSAGAFFGFRLGRMDRGVTPELAVYYDESALGIRERNVIFVPSVTLQGISFLPRIFR
jgi:hypothetical protein